MNRIATALCSASLLGMASLLALPSVAADPDLCLDCHEPAEDWEGMTAAEVFADAKNADIKRHADNMELSDDALMAIIAELLPE